MVVSLKHQFVSAKGDGPDSTLVQPSNWNAEHVLEQATNRLLGRTTALTGPTEEISVSGSFTLSGGTLGLVGNLTSLGNLTLVANRGLYSTGANTLALYTLSAYGRTLAGLNNSAALRADLNVYTQAEAVKKAGDIDLTGGFAAVVDNEGTISSGTYTPVLSEGNFKTVFNGGAFTLAAPATGGGFSIVVRVTNGAVAGAITFSGFNAVVGDTYETTNGAKFLFIITCVIADKMLNIVRIG